MLSYILAVEPIRLRLDRTRDFVRQVEAWRVLHHAALIFYQEGSDGLPVKYRVNMPREDRVIFINHPEVILQTATQGVFIASEENFQQLPKAVLMRVKEIFRGKIGHKKVVVFYK
ncbi:hypothetical protein AYO45_02285 [Gammaproteobacteria bacterium SCGC AG-212-F23]|nr:hypothetical protein AYO45_02285 [Gammaproteobacteria bacterium SCGC AG-212-F23]